MRLDRRSCLRLLALAGLGGGLTSLLSCRRSREVSSLGSGDGRIALLQYVSAPPADAARRGVIEALGAGTPLITRVAEGSPSRCRELAEALVESDPALLVAIGTPPLVSAIAAAPRSLPVVFCYCSNPWGAGAGRSALHHRPNVTGTVTTTPVADQLRLARQLLPDLRSVGVIYNPAEPNAGFEAELLAQAARQQRLTLLREAVSVVADLPEAFLRLQHGGMQVLLKVGDYITLEGFRQLAALALQARLPLIGVDPADVDVLGCLAVVGWDPHQDGLKAGALAAQILRGTSPASIPIQPPGDQPGLWLNRRTAERLGIVLPVGLEAQSQPLPG